MNELPLTGVLPVHDRCMILLERALAMWRRSKGQTPGWKIDIDILYECLVTYRTVNARIGLCYRELSESAKDQFWCLQQGDEAFVVDPVRNRAVSIYTRSLPRLPKPVKALASSSRNLLRKDFSDPFGKLPLEILTLILLKVSKKSIVPAMVASRSLLFTQCMISIGFGANVWTSTCLGCGSSLGYVPARSWTLSTGVRYTIISARVGSKTAYLTGDAYGKYAMKCCQATRKSRT
ncbi:hypothetical protein K402DRAFT_152043 [Aulographum hederae CBS 113979]|uniref:F-box domain-containing protein n=1 Tax=Aulographum hederae CBS 113979 TaxID=1176131 RepID=A0A6G1GSL0_9PEZI|nr:hypothetical protein K402DRAFT_152043 [Aulographum hederae CBS 113979]